jgi:hypothetical protein
MERRAGVVLGTTVEGVKRRANYFARVGIPDDMPTPPKALREQYFRARTHGAIDKRFELRG